MNAQELTAAKTTGNKTGKICTKTGSYRASTAKTEFVIFLRAGDAFPVYPGNDASSTTWYVLSNGTGSSEKASFSGVLAPAE